MQGWVSVYSRFEKSTQQEGSGLEVTVKTMSLLTDKLEPVYSKHVDRIRDDHAQLRGLLDGISDKSSIQNVSFTRKVLHGVS